MHHLGYYAIVRKIPGHTVARGPAYIEPFFNKRGSNATALVFRVHYEGCKSNGRSNRPGRFDGDGGNQDMPDYPVAMNRDK